MWLNAYNIMRGRLFNTTAESYITIMASSSPFLLGVKGKNEKWGKREKIAAAGAAVVVAAVVAAAVAVVVVPYAAVAAAVVVDAVVLFFRDNSKN